MTTALTSGRVRSSAAGTRSAYATTSPLRQLCGAIAIGCSTWA
ncbi:hypothetical protein [Micromonospora endophytica]|nr:hypothetical protein [Micromonospora endophytica]